MKYLVKNPDGPSYSFTLEELKASVGRGKIDDDWLVCEENAKPREWTKVAELLNLPRSRARRHNKVLRVDLTGGLIGWLLSDPRSALEGAIQQANREGWHVVEVLPDARTNLIMLLARLIILVVTLFLFTTDNGYLVILEKSPVVE